MIVTPRSTPEVPYQATNLPRPLGPHPAPGEDDGGFGSLHVPDPTLSYKPFGPPNMTWTRLSPQDPVWTEGDTTRDGVKLSNGGRRFGGPHSGRIEGLSIGGSPVEYMWKGHNYWWMLALDDVVDTLQLTGDAATHKIGKGTVTSRNGQEVPYQQFQAADGTQRLALTLPGNRPLHVTSKMPLARQAIDTLCGALAECPAVALKGLQDIYVVEALGEKVDDQGQGPAHPLSAITRAGLPDIVFVHERLCDPELGRHVVLHEVGHLVDGLERIGCVSNVQQDDQGQILFGNGQPVTSPDHVFDLSHDDYVSYYGSLSGKEDFAEMHAEVMKQRTEFNLANDGHDLLTEPPQIASAYLSPRLGMKAETVVERYQQLGIEAPETTSWLTKMARRLMT